MFSANPFALLAYDSDSSDTKDNVDAPPVHIRAYEILHGTEAAEKKLPPPPRTPGDRVGFINYRNKNHLMMDCYQHTLPMSASDLVDIPSADIVRYLSYDIHKILGSSAKPSMIYIPRTFWGNTARGNKLIMMSISRFMKLIPSIPFRKTGHLTYLSQKRSETRKNIRHAMSRKADAPVMYIIFKHGADRIFVQILKNMQSRKLMLAIAKVPQILKAIDKFMSLDIHHMYSQVMDGVAIDNTRFLNEMRFMSHVPGSYLYRLMTCCGEDAILRHITMFLLRDPGKKYTPPRERRSWTSWSSHSETSDDVIVDQE